MTSSPVRDALVAYGRSSGEPVAAVLAQVAAALADRAGLPVDARALALVAAAGAAARPDAVVSGILGAATRDEAVPDLLGQVHEGLMDRGHRQRRGVFYTPADVADGIAELIDWPEPGGRPIPRVCDLSCGGGAFLLAAGRALERRGWDRSRIVSEALWGVDVDPLAVAVASTSLALWAAAGPDPGPHPGPPAASPALVAGDTLASGPAVWNGRSPSPGGFDVILGNPPFQNQLGRRTARPAQGAGAAVLRERFGEAAFRYTDTAALFLLEGCRWARPGGQVALVLPQSVLVTADARALRRDVLALGSIEQLWVAGEPVFDALVRVCVPVIRRHAGGPAATSRVRVARGRRFTPAGSVAVDPAELASAPTWAVLRAAVAGVPHVDLDPAGDGTTLGSVCTATAGFRDQFYGVAPFVDEAGPGDRRARLVTCGLVDPARCLWAGRPTRFAGRRWAAPVVDVDRLGRDGEPALVDWVRRRLVPKVVVATQTRVLEAAVDERGDWFPSVPTIALTPRSPRLGLWDAAAVVLAPPVSAWALARHGGAALSDDTAKLSARQLLDIPLPVAAEPWGRAAEALRSAAGATDGASWQDALSCFGLLMCEAYGTDPDVSTWWERRLPPWR